MIKVMVIVVFWIVLLILLPGFVSICSQAFDNSTGTFALLYSSMDNSNPMKQSSGLFLGVGGVLPWLLPLAFFVGTIWWLIKGEVQKPDIGVPMNRLNQGTNRAGSFVANKMPGVLMQRNKTPKAPKQKKPKIIRL